MAHSKREKKKGKASDGDGGNSATAEDTIIEKRKPYLSVKDSTVIILLSTFLSVSLVVGTLGVNGILEKLTQNDVLDVFIVIILFIGLFSVLSYILVKFAAHYLVYVAIGTLCALIFPVSPQRQRRALKELSQKADKRQ